MLAGVMSALSAMDCARGRSRHPHGAVMVGVRAGLGRGHRSRGHWVLLTFETKKGNDTT